MKILFIDFFLPYLINDNDFPAGGTTNQLVAWLKGLSATNNEVGVLTWKGARKYIDQEVDFNLIEAYRPKTGIKFIRYFYVYFPGLLKATKEFSPDVIIQSPSGIETGLMGCIANRLHIPFIHRVANDRDTDNRMKHAAIPIYAKLGYQYGLRQTTATICQNQYQSNSLKKKYPEKQHYILHNPFCALHQLPLSRKPENKSYIAWVGIFKRQKNLPLLYEIARNIPEILFKVAGMRSDQTDSVCEDALVKLTTLDNVELVGFVKRHDMFGFLNDAFALLSTSFFEGFSNVLLEAMAVGTPVILPDRVDPDGIIARNQLGRVSTRDEQLPTLVKELVSMPHDQYTTLSCRCRDYVQEHHDPVTKASEMLTILQQVHSDYHAK